MSPGQETNTDHSTDIEQNKHLCPHKACVIDFDPGYLRHHWLPSFACLLNSS